ncbi:MAG TPA: PilN domain-containing protein [Thermoanaerobaculia bacterium]|jgi:Tfp pilus assembly protein PilN|nr:PilN domain-containing protein [Thermoanaerobaculia bacterium]
MSTLDGNPPLPPTPSPPSDDEAPVPAVPAAPVVLPPGPPLDRIEPLNLARRPFLNSRPVVRVALLLWLFGFALLLWNVVQFQRYLAESADKRAQIERGEREITRQRQINAGLKSRLDDLDLDQLNERVEFLNEKIEERTFSWSLLLDRLAEVLPNDVRLLRLTPQTQQEDQRGARRRKPAANSGPRRIPLTISGETRDDDALLRFVDNLFAHPAFADPNPTREDRVGEAGNLVNFDLSVQYIPGGTPQGVVIEEAPSVEELPAPAPGTSAGTPGTPGRPGAPGAPVGDRP